MSYDLFLRGKDHSPTASELDAYFLPRAHFKKEGGQYWYQNESTGVYFWFSVSDGDESSEDAVIHFNLNYFRPSFFGVEAQIEVAKFVHAFDLVIEDPQMEGMGQGHYDPERFLSGWNHGNRFAHQSVLASRDFDGQEFLTLPGEKLMRAWRWNYEKESLQGALGEDTFVPTVMLIRSKGATFTAQVWPDGIPIASANPDCFLVPRDELAPKKLFSRKRDLIVVPANVVMQFMSPYFVDRSGVAVMNYVTPPDAVKNFVRSLTSIDDAPQIVASDSVLDRELYDEAKAG